MEAKRIVGWNTRRVRVERGLTIEELADRADIDASYLARIERGSVNPSIEVIARVARALRVRLNDLVADIPSGTTPPRPLRAGRRRAK
jgi:transcriptional regulator with XRE-family HTH domain